MPRPRLRLVVRFVKLTTLIHAYARTYSMQHTSKWMKLAILAVAATNALAQPAGYIYGMIDGL